MTRLDWIYLKAGVPASVVAVVAFVIALKLKGLQTSQMLAGVAGYAPWVALVGFGAALVMFAAPTWRLWRWERGEGPMCHRCGGPLGHEIDGRYGPYRRCLACDGNSSACYCSRGME